MLCYVIPTKPVNVLALNRKCILMFSCIHSNVEMSYLYILYIYFMILKNYDNMSIGSMFGTVIFIIAQFLVGYCIINGDNK